MKPDAKAPPLRASGAPDSDAALLAATTLPRSVAGVDGSGAGASGRQDRGMLPVVKAIVEIGP